MILESHLQKKVDLERTIKVAVLLMKSGACKQNSIFNEVAELSLVQQKADGGWIGVEDSCWAVSFLKEFTEYSPEYLRGSDWLRKQQLESGAWGQTSRDIGRIPITGILLYLLPELSNKNNLQWLENEWKKDFLSNTKLTYKGAFSLMALKSVNSQFADGDLFEDTLSWLASQQNEDFGWGPFRNHPVGSSPFYTGVALIGLLQYPDLIDRNVIVNGLNWLERNQLEDGLWPDHYIEQGSAWSFYALTKGYKFLKDCR